jgi:hypothetical protein
LNTLPTANTTANACPMTGAAATPRATPAPAPTLAPALAPLRALSRHPELLSGAVVLASAVAPAGVLHVISSGEVEGCTVTVPGAANCHLPAGLAAWHCSGPPQAGSSASTRTSMACDTGNARVAQPESRETTINAKVPQPGSVPAFTKLLVRHVV